MEMFCRRCKNILVWDFTGGRRVKKCPRCGFVDEPLPHKEEGPSIPKVRKGVAPGSAEYGRRSLRDHILSGEGEEEKRTSSREIKAPPPGSGAPAPGMFPFDTIRPGQEEFHNDVADAIANGRILIASVPTGIGKTAAALSPAVEDALKRGGLVLFMTSKQSQHAIAVETLRRISKRTGRKIKVVDVISKQAMCPRDLSHLPNYAFNYLCRSQAKDGTCPHFKAAPDALIRAIKDRIMDVSELKDEAVRYRICPHKAALEAAKGAHVLICDFNYLFSDLTDIMLAGLGKDLSDLVLIVDEAHNLPDRIRSHQKDDLSMYGLDEALIQAGRNRRIKPLLRRIRDIIVSEGEKLLTESGEKLVDRRELVSHLRGVFQETIDGSFDLEDLIELLEEEGKKRKDPEEENPLLHLSSFLNKILSNSENHILFFSIPEGKDGDSMRLTFRSLDPGEISGRIFKGCRSAVLMSGTLKPPSMFGDILGIARGRRMENEYPSPFPRDNKLVLVDRSVTTAYAKRSRDMYQRIGERITRIASSSPGNIAVFFPSYQIMWNVKDHIPHMPRRMLVERKEMSKSQKEGLVEDLIRSKRGQGAVLMGVMGGSLSEGVDYKDNILSTVVIVGLPLAPPSLEVKAVRDLYRKRYGMVKGDEYSYEYPAVNRILQAAGRSIRSETDRAAIIMLEERMAQPKYLKYLPEEMRPDSTSSVEGRMGKFF